MAIEIKILIFFLLTGCLGVSQTSHAQSIFNLVVWNSIKNTELVARDIHKSEEKKLRI
jgi:hypothetical protein